MSPVWTTLNNRQRRYLRALYMCDQASASAHIPLLAGMWRWQPYGPTARLTALYGLLRAIGDSGQDADAIWQELEKRNFLQRRHVRIPSGGKTLEVQLTRKGRQLVRRAIGERVGRSSPKGKPLL
jgi:hypothetical protein